MTTVIKPKGSEVSIGTANTVGDSVLVRVINTGAAANLTFAYANGTSYANVTVSNTESVVVEKAPSDTLAGANMRAISIAYRN